MMANLFGQGTKGGILGINAEGTMLTLSRTVDFAVDYKDFKEFLEDFINVMDFWQKPKTPLPSNNRRHHSKMMANLFRQLSG